MLKFAMLVLASALVSCSFAQVGGGSAAFGQQRQNAADANERAKRVVSKDEMPPDANSTFIDASVLINVKADEYVAVFGISHEGATLEEARQKMDATVAAFMQDVKGFGIKENDLYVDFVAQNRIYGFEVAGDLAREKIVGFEVKKNVSIRYQNPADLDRFIAAASKSQIFDLVKVDYIVKDIAAIQKRLMATATAVVKRKAANLSGLMGNSNRKPVQIYAERYSSYYPTDMYRSYIAEEAESITSYRQNLTVQRARKPRSFYLDPLAADTFDQVINPAVTEPVVQFTLYLKVRYAPAPLAAKAGRKKTKES